VRIERAIDAFLDWRRVERDATESSVDSYWRILVKLAEDYPEAELGLLTTEDLRRFLNRWRQREASTRANVISVLHSFFGWAESEDLIDVDPSRKIRRPPKRKPDVYRPSLDELSALRIAAVGFERPPILMMEGAGLRSAEVRACRWVDVDLVRGRVRIHRKGSHWHWLPIDPDVLIELRQSFRELAPDLDDYIFTVEVEVWVSQFKRERRRKDPKKKRSAQALWRLVKRVSARAEVTSLSPHPLRHGFANRFLRESRRDVFALQGLMGHSQLETTRGYLDEIGIDDLADALADAASSRCAQASSELETERDEAPEDPESLQWRRRESNPRPRTHRTECLRA
jgi:site-specific recombinase XerD